MSNNSKNVIEFIERLKIIEINNFSHSERPSTHAGSFCATIGVSIQVERLEGGGRDVYSDSEETLPRNNNNSHRCR
jgi:tRNA A37 methylthiotransferase MiaB